MADAANGLAYATLPQGVMSGPTALELSRRNADYLPTYEPTSGGIRLGSQLNSEPSRVTLTLSRKSCEAFPFLIFNALGLWRPPGLMLPPDGCGPSPVCVGQSLTGLQGVGLAFQIFVAPRQTAIWLTRAGCDWLRPPAALIAADTVEITVEITRCFCSRAALPSALCSQLSAWMDWSLTVG